MDDDEALVLAMPRRELFAVDGFVAPRLEILASLAEESFYTRSAALVGSVEAKEVRLGVVFERADQLLLDEEGTLVHVTGVPPETTRLGEGLAALRRLALLAGEALLEASAKSVILAGCVNRDTDPDLRACLVLIYRFTVDSTTPSPPGFSWLSRATLRGLQLDPLAALVVPALPRD